MGNLNVTTDELKKSATKFKTQLIITPVISANATLMHMTGRPGVAGREVVGQLSGDIEIGPYDPNRVDNNGMTITPRVLETYLGSVVKDFDPNSAAKTVWGLLTAQGDALKSADISMQVLTYLSANLGKALGACIWSAKRNESGTKTKDLFDGFDTITQQEIDGNNISTAAGNLHEFGAAISHTNAVEMLQAFYESAADELQSVKTKLYVSKDIYNAYKRDYAARFNAAPYNRTYEKVYLEGSDDLCEIVALSSKKGSPFVHLAPASNLLYGYGAGLADENIAIEKYKPFTLSYVATMYFGTQFESISKEFLHVGKLHS